MDDPVARLKAGLDADEAAARRDLQSYAGPPGRRKAAERVLRQAAAHREILAEHVGEPPAVICRRCKSGFVTPCPTIRALAAVYGDDDT